MDSKMAQRVRKPPLEKGRSARDSARGGDQWRDDPLPDPSLFKGRERTAVAARTLANEPQTNASLTRQNWGGMTMVPCQKFLRSVSAAALIAAGVSLASSLALRSEEHT